MIAPFSIQKVKDRADIIEVVSQFVKLKRRGANYLGNCPFHNEKTPSFTVSQTKGIYKCFGCGKSGNTITFIEDHEKLTYPEAVKWLAKFYNIELEETAVTPEIKEQQLQEESLRIVNQFASKHFQNNLNNTEEGKTIGLSYFEERGFLPETIETFQLGYALENRESLISAASKEGHKIDLLTKCGLVNNKNGRAYDNYSGRVIFPIHNVSGRIIGFGARILKTNDKAPKYINTPENEIYNKSKTLYGLFFARNTVSKLNECLLVEGYTDVISLYQAGVQNVVASSGTSLTTEQIKLIKRYTKNLTIIYDGDAAGIKAALRGLNMAIEEGMNVQLVLLPENHDPDSFVKENGAEYFRNYIAQNKKDIILFKLEASLKEAGNDSIKKAELINEIAETISKINKIEDFTKQQDYIKRSSSLLNIDEQGLISLVNKKIREQVVKNKTLPQEEAEKLEQLAQPQHEHSQEDEASLLLKKDYLQEKNLVKVLLEYGNKPYNDDISVAEYIKAKIDLDEGFDNTKWLEVIRAYFNYLETTLQYPSLDYFTHNENKVIFESAIEALQYNYEISPNWKNSYNIEIPEREILYLEEVESVVVYYQARKLKTIMNEYLEQLKDENSSDADKLMHLNMFQELKKHEVLLLKNLNTVLIK